MAQHTPIAEPAVTLFANLLLLLPLPGVVQAQGEPMAKAPVKTPAVYEVYGLDREGRRVEACFNPATSRLARKNVAH